ncbi:LysR family transcriptional regulator [Klebsiella pneumoniae]|nr:LysR family transcriptional regulator [Klebsiella pneumoniae]
MTTSRLHSLDIRLLRAFAVVAEENNISRAAQRLFISQPPLTRHIRHLEAQLGVTLFQRHSKGLILTDAGKEVLEMIQPLLALQERTLAALSELAVHSPQALRLGVTTAFEQGIFAAVEAALSEHTRALHITATPHRRWLSRYAKANSMRRWSRCRSILKGCTCTHCRIMSRSLRHYRPPGRKPPGQS